MQQSLGASEKVTQSTQNPVLSYQNQLKSDLMGTNASNNCTNTENIKDQSIVATVVNALVVGLLMAAGGSIAAWALTSISPISGAIMSGTFVATFILTLDLLPEDYKGFSFLAAAIATNLVVYGAFPYLGLEAISWVTVTVFSAVTTLTGAILANAFQPEKKLELDFSYLNKKQTTSDDDLPSDELLTKVFDNLFEKL